eukprot:1128221-Alexandrium_andersonii.AAC.1
MLCLGRTLHLHLCDVREHEQFEFLLASTAPALARRLHSQVLGVSPFLTPPCTMAEPPSAWDLVAPPPSVPSAVAPTMLT